MIEFGINRKRMCNFLLVRHNNLGPILDLFGDIAGFMCHPVDGPINPNSGGVSVGLDRACWVQPEQKP